MLRMLEAEGLLSPAEHRIVAAIFRQHRRERSPPPKRWGTHAAAAPHADGALGSSIVQARGGQGRVGITQSSSHPKLFMDLARAVRGNGAVTIGCD